MITVNLRRKPQSHIKWQLSPIDCEAYERFGAFYDMSALLCEYTTCCLQSVKRFEGTAEYQILEINLNTAWGVFFFFFFHFFFSKKQVASYSGFASCVLQNDSMILRQTSGQHDMLRSGVTHRYECNIRSIEVSCCPWFAAYGLLPISAIIT